MPLSSLDVQERLDREILVNSYWHVTEIGHQGPLGCDVQRDENRQYAPNQAFEYLV